MERTMGQREMARPNKLIIVGDSAFAEIACEYFEQNTEFRVACFAVESGFRKRATLLGKPVVDLESLAQSFPPSEHAFYAAITYGQLNRLRRRLHDRMIDAGYPATSYVSPHAFVAATAKLGSHCFIMENNVVQPSVTIGDNVVLWSGNHIGHHSRIGDNVFVSSHVVVSGFCQIGANSFLGVNATIGNNITVGKDCWIGPGAVIAKDTKDGEIYRAPESTPAKVSAWRFFKVAD
jgi:sugar O-acyltransferase (sialic acid O-acetyltransferase NeuD family)